MASRLFGAHGELCASHPWEVIVATLTLTACLLTFDRQQTSTVPHDASPPPHKSFRYCVGCLPEVCISHFIFINKCFVKIIVQACESCMRAHLRVRVCLCKYGSIYVRKIYL